MILLRLKFIPSWGAYLFYIFFIFSAVAEFCRPGLNTLNNKSDVSLILFFFVYYFLSSIIYVGIIDPCVPMDWLPKDLLYSVLPILFYVLVRLTRRELDAQLLLRYTLVAIITYDIIALLILFMPWTPIVSLFESETVENEAGVSFALSGIVGVIGTGFLNVIGFAICMLSPIRLNRIIKYSLSVVLFICVLLSGQRTPIGGLAIVLIVSLFSFNKKYFLGVSIVLFILALLYYNTNLVVNDLEIKDALFSRYFDRLDILMSGDSGRDYQYQILK